MTAPREPGLQPERTALAWQRTAFTAAVLAVLLLRAGLAAGAVWEIAAGVCAAGVVLVSLVAARTPARTGSPRWRLAAVTCAAVGTGVCTAVRILLDR